MTTISDLMALIPPPTKPAKIDTQNWQAVCNRVGINLPNDLRELGLHYGSGEFNQGDLRVHNPFDSEYPAAIDDLSKRLRECVDALLIDESYGVFPDSGGLYPLGFNGSGYDLNWVMKGKSSDQWPIVIIIPGYEDETEHWDMPLIEFLFALFTNKIKTRMYPEPLTAANWNFRPREE